MPLKIRFLLTSKCTATCAYCHNEGQSDATTGLLRLEQIEHLLGRFAQHNLQPDEIILSGGEPTLHKNLGVIAQRCKKATRHLSMNSHGGHPELLSKALPYLDELKLHIDSFDAEEQRRSMGIKLVSVDESIRRAHTYPTLKLIANHPLTNVHSGIRFVTEARARRIDCKIIDLFGTGFAPSVNWQHQGYTLQEDGDWLHSDDTHRIFTKNCSLEHNSHDQTYFIAAEGIRLALDTPIIADLTDFDPA